MSTTDFLASMKQKCEAKAKQMNALELSIWNEKHESELKQYFGFTDKSLNDRKEYLSTHS
jgi:hypothetical protein